MSPAMTHLLGISREFIFGVCSHGRLVQVPAQQGRRRLLQRGKGRWEGCPKQRVSVSSWASPCQERSKSVFFLLGSVILMTMRAPLLAPTLFN